MPRTEHMIDWRKTAIEIDAEFTVMAEDRDRLLRERKDMVVEISKLTRLAEAADRLRTFMVWHGEANTKDHEALDLFEAVLVWRPNEELTGAERPAGLTGSAYR